MQSRIFFLTMNNNNEIKMIIIRYPTTMSEQLVFQHCVNALMKHGLITSDRKVVYPLFEIDILISSTIRERIFYKLL
jgi:hypothetical protein